MPGTQVKFTALHGMVNHFILHINSTNPAKPPCLGLEDMDRCRRRCKDILYTPMALLRPPTTMPARGTQPWLQMPIQSTASTQLPQRNGPAHANPSQNTDLSSSSFALISPKPGLAPINLLREGRMKLIPCLSQALVRRLDWTPLPTLFQCLGCAAA